MSDDKIEMQILKSHDKKTGWLTAEICGRWVQAKVFDKPSSYGINGGRVSKLSIGRINFLDGYEKDFLDRLDFHYDRGESFNNLPDGMLQKIVSKLESLPRLFQ